MSRRYVTRDPQTGRFVSAGYSPANPDWRIVDDPRVDRTSYCWVWTGSLITSGYGQVTNGVLAHRVAWEQANEESAEGWIIMHTCDNKACVNPDHLRKGTYQDNTLDAMAKGRQDLSGLDRGRPPYRVY